MQWFRRIFQVSPAAEKERIFFFNSLGREIRDFKPPAKGPVRMYNCGPTVYDRQHIGNLSAAVFADTIRRVLEYNGLTVKQVINITDFGHLVSDSDEGEDKMTKGLKREKKALTMENMREFATKYMNIYLDDIKSLNVSVEKILFPRASDYVQPMIAMIRTLEEKGYAYQIKDGVYFDTSRFPNYGALGGISDGQEEGAPYSAEATKGRRIAINQEKRTSHDFALWKSVPPRSKLGWDSPWGKGFPGWHMECSAMIHSILGDQIDIHTGGIEHIPIHHNNEIAQSEAATGKRPMSRFWLHREHIRMENTKISKSIGNTAYLSDVVERGIHPLALRYWFLTAHYRQPANFTWEAVEAAQKAFLRLHGKYRLVKHAELEEPASTFSQKFTEKLNNDLDTPGAIATIWENVSGNKLTDREIKAILLRADRVLGLGFEHSDELLEKLLTPAQGVAIDSLPEDARKLYDDRETARAQKDWATSDRLRAQLRAAGYEIKDTPDGSKILRI